jgi:hypothetical protein
VEESIGDIPGNCRCDVAPVSGLGLDRNPYPPPPLFFLATATGLLPLSYLIPRLWSNLSDLFSLTTTANIQENIDKHSRSALPLTFKPRTNVSASLPYP